MMKTELYRLIELLIIVAASISPLFILASKVSSDEFWKGSASISIAAVAGAVAGVYRMWKAKQEDNPDE